MNHQKPIVIVTLLCLAAVAAGEATTQPATTTQPAGEALKVTVVSVEGLAEKLAAGQGDEWTPLRAGDELDELTVIRTGLRTKVVLRFADRGEVVVDRATKIGVGEFSRQGGGLVRTRLGLKYGTMRATVDSSRGPNDVEVSTPVATLTVRGTAGDIGYSGDRGLGLRGRAGTWRLAVGNRSRSVQAGEAANNQLTPSFEIMKRQREIVLGDLSGGLTADEIDNIISNPAPANPSEPGNSGSSPLNPSAPSVSPLPDDHISPGI